VQHLMLLRGVRHKTLHFGCLQGRMFRFKLVISDVY
jgi:hypothetical protein